MVGKGTRVGFSTLALRIEFYQEVHLDLQFVSMADLTVEQQNANYQVYALSAGFGHRKRSFCATAAVTPRSKKSTCSDVQKCKRKNVSRETNDSHSMYAQTRSGYDTVTVYYCELTLFVS